MPQVRPAPIRQIKLHLARFGEHRRHQDRITEHILAVKIVAGRIVLKLEHHRTQHRRAELVGQRRLAIKIRHHAAFQLREVAHHITGLFVVGPWHPIGFAAVQPAVAGEQAEGAPALVDVGRRGVSKPPIS